jgi:hypothetical protein
MHVYLYVYVCMCMSLCARKCTVCERMYVCVNLCTYMNIHMLVCVYIYIYMCVCVCVCVYTYIHTYIYIYIYIYNSPIEFDIDQSLHKRYRYRYAYIYIYIYTGGHTLQHPFKMLIKQFTIIRDKTPVFWSEKFILHRNKSCNTDTDASSKAKSSRDPSSVADSGMTSDSSMLKKDLSFFRRDVATTQASIHGDKRGSEDFSLSGHVREAWAVRIHVCVYVYV